MRSAMVLSMACVLAGCMKPHPASVAAKRATGCPSGIASVGTPAWIDAHKAILLGDQRSSPAPGTLVGLVLDLSGAPLVGAEVALRRGRIAPGDDTWFRVRRTTADGTFHFDSIAAEDYVLQFRKVRFEAQWHAHRGIPAVADSLCIQMRAAPPFKLAPLSTD